MIKASLNEKFTAIQEHWRPKVVAALNGQELKLLKFRGVFPWHHHENEDELFLVWRGQMIIEFRGRDRVFLQPGEFCVVPRGVEHRTMAETEAEVLIFEPAAPEILSTIHSRPRAVLASDRGLGCWRSRNKFDNLIRQISSRQPSFE